MAQLAVAVALTAATTAITYELGNHSDPNNINTTVTSSAYGESYPLAYGTVRLGTKLIWCSGIQVKKGSKFGKGGSSAPQQYAVANLAVAICQGPVDQLIRIWANGAIIYDKTGTLLKAENQFGETPTKGELVGNGDYRFRFYPGDEVQLPDPLIVANIQETVGLNATPAYRGTSYIVFEDMNLSNFSNALPSIAVEVTTNGKPALPIEPITLLPGTPTQTYTPTVPSGAVFDFTTVSLYTWDSLGINVIDYISSTMTRRIAMTGLSQDTSKAGIRALGVCPGKYFVVQQAATGDYVGQAGGGDSAFVYVLDINSGQELSHSLIPVPTSSFGYGEFFGVNTILGVPVTIGTDTAHFAVLSVYRGTIVVMSADFADFYPTQFSVAGGTSNVGSYATLMVLGKQESNYTEVWGSASISDVTIPLSKITIDASANAWLLLAQGPLGAAGAGAPEGVTVATWVTLTLADLLLPSTTNQINIQKLVYGYTDDSVYIFYYTYESGSLAGAWITKYTTANGVVWTIPGDSGEGTEGFDGGSDLNSLITNDQLGFISSSGAYLVDTITGQTIWSYPFVAGSATAPGGSLAYVGIDQSVLQQNGRVLQRVLLDRFDGQTETVGNIVSDICVRSGLSLEQIDVGQLTDTISGYVIGNVTDGKTIISNLASGFFFDAVESDYILRFVKRGTQPILTIPQSDLGQIHEKGQKGAKDDNYWNITTTQELELPLEVHCRYYDLGLNYQRNDQYSRRVQAPVPSMHAKSITSIDLPAALNASQAVQIAQRSLFSSWVERNAYDSVLGWKYLALDATDVVYVSLDDGSSYNVMIKKMTIGADYSLAISFVAQDLATYSSEALGDTGSGPLVAVSTLRPPTSIVPLALPLLKDSDDEGQAAMPFYYTCGTMMDYQWPGALVSKSSDGDTYSTVAIDTTGMTWGTVAKPLPTTHSQFSLDNKTQLVVYLFPGAAGTLSSTTMDLMLGGANQAAVGSEIIQFLNASLNADNSYTLTGLLRGRRGSDASCDFHKAGEYFVLLDAAVQIDTYPTADVGRAETYQAATIGSLVTNAQPQGTTYNGAPLMPYAPANITRSFTSAGTILSWFRRTRLNGNLVDGTGIAPLFEISEEYVVYILPQPYSPTIFDPTNSSTYYRSYNGLTVPTVTYLAADMATDGFNEATSTLHVVVYQLSSAVGRGFPGWANLAPGT